LVVNDAATLPAPAGRPPPRADRARLLGPTGATPGRARRRRSTSTQHRPPPRGWRDPIGFAAAWAPRRCCSPLSPRLVELRFDRDGAALWAALYVAGAPVQYAHVPEPLDLWSVQTVYAARPWAAEMPSAGRPLTWEILSALRRRGIGLAALTHAAGLSATGDPAIDAALPLPERYQPGCDRSASPPPAPPAPGGRVGTVVRAWRAARQAPASFAPAPARPICHRPGFRPHRRRAVSGIHTPGESHWHVVSAFAGAPLLARAAALAAALGFRTHELGDATLIVAAGRDRD
jgi:S-adenosylmethionine:tRNA ribosyltransferase-isomerase